MLNDVEKSEKFVSEYGEGKKILFGMGFGATQRLFIFKGIKIIFIESYPDILVYTYIGEGVVKDLCFLGIAGGIRTELGARR